MKTITLTISSKDYTVRLEDDFYVAFERDWKEILGGKRFLEPKDLLNAFVKKSFDAYSNETVLKELCRNISDVTGNTKDDINNENEVKNIHKDSQTSEEYSQNSGIDEKTYNLLNSSSMHKSKNSDGFNNAHDSQIDNSDLQVKITTNSQENDKKSEDYYLEFQNKHAFQSTIDSYPKSQKLSEYKTNDLTCENQSVTHKTEKIIETNENMTKNMQENEIFRQIDLISDIYTKNLNQPVSPISLGHKGVTVTLPLLNNPPLTSECVANTPLNELSKAEKMSMTNIDLLSDKKDKFFVDSFDNILIKKSN